MSEKIDTNQNMLKQKLPKHVHIIGICGVATSALAIAFHKAGVKVTGSDKGFFPPVSTELENNNISFYAGWHPEKMIGHGVPDFVMIGGTGTSPNNPETVYAKENNIPSYSFAEVLQKYIIKENSIVVTGTWGKTTTSAILSYILIQSGINPSYFTGGLSMSHPTGALSKSNWSIVEGDEYQVSIRDKRPKFVYYAPTHLLLTSVSWDHADLYPTEKDYFDTFEKLIGEIPANGLIVACADNSGVNKLMPQISKNEPKSSSTGTKIISYGKSNSLDYSYHSISYTKNGLHFQISSKNGCFEIYSPMLGRFNVENITGAFAMASEMGIPNDKIIESIKNFKGIKRRLEKRSDGDITVLDCHAPTAEKALSVLESIREVYKNKVIAIFEPNIGGRAKETTYKYDQAFKDCDTIIIPRLTKLKVSNTTDGNENDADTPIEGKELAEIIAKTHPDVIYIDDDKTLVDYLISNTKKDDCIAFLGSHGFRGMIEETVNKLI